MKEFLKISALLMLLAGCVSPPKADRGAVVDWPIFTTEAYSISYPSEVEHRIDRADGSVALTTNRGATAFHRPGDYFLILQTPLDSCAPSLTGASQAEKLSNDSSDATWGKVDYWDKPKWGGDPSPPSPICRPAFPQTGREYFPCEDPWDFMDARSKNPSLLPCKAQQRQYEVEHGMYSAYALCSEKDGKTVLICISQVTDNPDLAKQIFETFRWLD